ncbi:DoxX family protein [Streptomyces spectabilis]|uniref:DoxX family protein n=1 Tax=Streptomyces spectabilis TaxID=68270 RepID=A0A516R6D7_STRST|nr:DoxX family protein [Streptomyces spectabilis]QDQ11236.1 DoxX family protein [Streptomyces spectabilis]
MTCRRSHPCARPDRRDIGLLLLRTGTGAVLAAHGSQKLLGWFGGGGIEGTGAYFESVGYRPGKVNAVLAGLAEAGGGTLLALGLATPAAGAAAAGAMAGAAPVHAPNGFFNQSGGFEYPAVLGLVSAALAVTGPGRLSADHALGDVLNRAWMAPAALLATGVATAALIATRRRALRDAEA